MPIESPKFEKPQIPYEKKEKSETREKFEKKLRAMTVWGLVALSSAGILRMYPEYKEAKKTKAVIAYVEKEKGPLKEVEKIELKEKMDYLKKQFGNGVIPFLQKTVEFNKEANPKPVEVKGFEKVGLSNKDLQTLWSEKYYPKGWLEEEISKVEYLDKETRKEKLPYYQGETSALHIPSKTGKSEIKFLKSAFDPKTKKEWKDFIETLDWHLGHETGHANDWGNEAELDFKNRVEFLHEVTQNCFREGAFRDVLGYLDSIKHADPRAERYFKTKEYWAVCCENYFTFTEYFKENYPQEFEMVDKYVKKEDPTYDPFEKHEQRSELIEKIIEEKK